MMVIKIMIMTQPNIRFLIENALIMRMADYEDFLIWGTDNKDQFI